MQDAAERFDAKTIPEPTTGCVLWLGGTTSSGYGRFRPDGAAGREVGAHRWNFERTRGPIPAGLVLDHVVCDTPACVNEWHVEPSTIGANVLRGRGPSATAARRATCTNGHPYTPENTRIEGRARRCRACDRAKQRRWKARHARSS